MILRGSGKENRSPSPVVKKIQLGNRLKASTDNQTFFQASQDQGTGVSVPTIDTVNLQVFQKQINRIQSAYENQRRENWANCQQRTRLQNQLRILQVQRDNQYQENEKLRNQMKDLFAKLNDSQARANTQLKQFYGLQSQVKNLQYDIRKFQENQKVSHQRTQKLQSFNTQLLSQIAQLNSSSSRYQTDLKSKEIQVQMLRNSLQKIQIDNKRLIQSLQEKSNISSKQAQRIYKQLQNWKNAFEKKQRELEKKTSVLSQQNDAMKKTIDELTNQLESKPNVGLSKSLTLSLRQTKETNESNNEYYIRLFIKQTQIQKLSAKIKQLQQKNQFLQVQNSLLQKKLSQKTVFSPSGFQRYTEVQTAIFKNSEVKRQANDLRIQLETKQQQIEILQDNIAERNRQLETAINQLKKFQSQFEYERINHGNTVSELTSKKNRLERDLQVLRGKVEGLNKQCQEKDRIILTYINASKQRNN